MESDALLPEARASGSTLRFSTGVRARRTRSKRGPSSDSTSSQRPSAPVHSTSATHGASPGGDASLSARQRNAFFATQLQFLLGNHKRTVNTFTQPLGDAAQSPRIIMPKPAAGGVQKKQVHPSSHLKSLDSSRSDAVRSGTEETALTDSVFGKLGGTLAPLARDKADTVDVTSETHMLAFELLAAFVGTPEAPEASVPDLAEYLQGAFGITDEARDAAFETAAKRDVGNAGTRVQLRLKLVRASGVKGKDIDGLSDPYAVMEVLGKDDEPSLKQPFPKDRSRAKVRVSSVVNASLDPEWNETFYFDIPDPIEDARLIVTLWDSDTGSQAKSFSRVRIAGAARLLKDFHKTVRGMSEDDFLGWAEKWLSDVPASGTTESLTLHRRSAHSHVGGSVNISVSFFSRGSGTSTDESEDPSAIHIAETHARDDVDRYQNLVNELVAYEVAMTATAQAVTGQEFVWVPVLSLQAHAVLMQAKIQLGISRLQDDICALCALIAVHEHPPNRAPMASVDLRRVTETLVSVRADLSDEKKSCRVFRDHLDDAVEVLIDRLLADLGHLLHRYLITRARPEVTRLEEHLATLAEAYAYHVWRFEPTSAVCGRPSRQPEAVVPPRPTLAEAVLNVVESSARERVAMLAIAARIGGDGWANEYTAMLRGAGPTELIARVVGRSGTEFEGHEVVQCIQWIQLLRKDLQAYTRGSTIDDQDNHCNNCRKPDRSSTRQGFRRVLAPFGGDLAAYARVAAVVDQALSTEDDGGISAEGGGETAGARWSLASAGSVARASLSSFGSDLGVALDAVMEISPQRVLAGILRIATHSDGVRDEKAEKDDLGRFGFTFELYFELKSLCLDELSHVDDASFYTMKLPNFPAWFYDHIVNWVDLSLANGQRIIRNTVSTDEVHPVVQTVSHSASVVDVCRILGEVWGFWEALEPIKWRASSASSPALSETPLLDKAQILNVQIAKSVCDIVEFYGAALLNKAQEQGLFFAGSGARMHVIHEQVCVVMNNLHEIRVNLEPLERKLLDYMRALKTRVEGSGDPTNIVFMDTQIKTAELLFTTSHQELDRHLNDLVQLVCKKVSDEMSDILASTIRKFKSDPGADLTECPEQAAALISEFLDYVENNLEVIDRLCYDDVSLLVEKRLWVECLLSIKDCLAPPLDRGIKSHWLTAQQRWLLAKWFFMEIKDFFHQGGDGLPWEEMTMVNARYLDLFFNVERICILEIMDPAFLVAGYLRKVAVLRPKQVGPLGSVSACVQVSALSDSVHRVTINALSASGLLHCADKGSKRNTYLIATLHPVLEGSSKSRLKTAVVKGTCQPVWTESLSWDVVAPIEDCVVHLEVFDADHFHSDTALGECCILLTSEAAAFVDGERLTLVLTAAVPRESTEFEGVIPNATTEAERAQNASAEDMFRLIFFNQERDKDVAAFVKRARRLYEHYKDVTQ